MKEWGHASASQIKTFRRCQRKWWFEKIMGYTSPGTPATELGRKIHAQLETYLLEGVRPESPIAQAGLHYLPEPQAEGLLIEEEFRYTEDIVAPVIGFIDLVEKQAGRITDHKTTSDFKWTKSEYELADDPQAVIYSQYAMRSLFPEADTIIFRHVYYRTKGASAARQTEIEFTRRSLEERFEGIAHTVSKMSDASKVIEPGGVEENEDACRDYGGCPFRGNCAKLGMKTYGQLSGLIKNQGAKKMPATWLDNIKKKKANVSSPVQKEPATRSREQVVALIKMLAPEVEDARLGKLDDKELAALEKHLSAKRASKVLAKGLVNPPDGTPMDRNTQVALEQGPAVQKEGREVRLTLDGKIRTDAVSPRKTVYTLPDGRNMRSMSKEDLTDTYWVYYEQMDDLQRAAWFNASSISDNVALAERAETRDLPKATEVREDLRLIVDILGQTTEQNSPQFNKVAKAVAENHTRNTSLAARKIRGDKVRKEISKLPSSMGGRPLQAIKAAEYPETVRAVLFEQFDQDLVEKWMDAPPEQPFSLTTITDSGEVESGLRQWVYDGCPDKHALKRTTLKKALSSFLTFVENGGVSVTADTPAEEEPQAVFNTLPEEPAIKEESTSTPTVGESEAVSKSEGNTLYVGCLPMNETVVFLHDFLKSFQESIAEDAAVPHYGLIPYNEGPKRVAALIRHRLHEGSLGLPSAMVCDARMPCSDAVLEVLKPLYSQVIERMW